MDKFEKRLKWRIWLCRGMIVLMWAVMLVIGEWGSGVLLDSRTMDDTAQSVSRILFFGTLTGLIVCIARTKRLLLRKLDRRERQVFEEDERRLAIRQKSGALAMEAMLALLMIAVFVLAFVDMTAFHTAYAILLAAGALKIGFGWFYAKRM